MKGWSRQKSGQIEPGPWPCLRKEREQNNKRKMQTGIKIYFLRVKIKQDKVKQTLNSDF